MASRREVSFRDTSNNSNPVSIMRIKTTLWIGLVLAGAATISKGATFIINNVGSGNTGDVLFAANNWSGDPNNNSTLLSGGTIAFGYFNSNLAESSFNTYQGLFNQLPNFIVMTTAVPGSPSSTLGGSRAGYVEQSYATSGGLIGAGSPLLGRSLYLIFTSASSLWSITAASEVGVLRVGSIMDDTGFENQYFGNPAGATIVLGSAGKFTGDASGSSTGTTVYDTVQFAVIPEPSAALLGTAGVLGLVCRRRR
jgi:hypothetical protein